MTKFYEIFLLVFYEVIIIYYFIPLQSSVKFAVTKCSYTQLLTLLGFTIMWIKVWTNIMKYLYCTILMNWVFHYMHNFKRIYLQTRKVSVSCKLTSDMIFFFNYLNQVLWRLFCYFQSRIVIIYRMIVILNNKPD